MGGVKVSGQRNVRGGQVWPARVGQRQVWRNKYWNGVLDVCARVVDREHRIADVHNVDGGAADELQRRIARHATVLDDIALSGTIVRSVVIPGVVNSKMGIVFATGTEVVRLTTRGPVVVHAVYCRAGSAALPEFLSGLRSGHPFPSSFDLRVACTHPSLADQFPSDKRIFAGGSDRRQIALQTEQCSRRSCCVGTGPSATGSRYKLVEVTVRGIRQSTSDRKLNRTRTRARILTVIGIGDGAQSGLVRGSRSTAAETQDPGLSTVTSCDAILVSESKEILGGVEVGGQRNSRAGQVWPARVGQRQVWRNNYWNGVLDVCARVVDRDHCRQQCAFFQPLIQHGDIAGLPQFAPRTAPLAIGWLVSVNS